MLEFEELVQSQTSGVWQEQPGNEFDDDANEGDMWRTSCCGADYDCNCP